MTSQAMTGVACASITMTLSSPTMIPLFGSPSVVNAQAFADSLRKEIFFGCKSACDANDFIAGNSMSPSATRQGATRGLHEARSPRRRRDCAIGASALATRRPARYRCNRDLRPFRNLFECGARARILACLRVLDVGVD